MQELFSVKGFYDQPFTIFIFFVCGLLMYLALSSIWHRFIGLFAASCLLFCAGLMFLSEANWRFEKGYLPAYDMRHIAGLTTVVLLAAVCLIRYLTKVRSDRIGPGSVREAFDELPDAVCFFTHSGTVRLCNRSMYELYFALTGKDLQSYDELKGMIKDRKEFEVMDRTWRYSEAQLSGDVTQSVFMDVSSRIRVKEELRSEAEKLKDISKELKVLSESVREKIRWKEMLDGKIRLHNSLGAALIALRRLMREDTVVYGKDLSLMKRAVDVLYGTSEYDDPDTGLADLQSDAAALGVEFKLSGKLPDDPEYGAFFVAVMREVLSNGVRHSDIDRIEIKMSDDRGQYVLETIVSGNLPAEDITPRGGLRNIIEKAEHYGGTVSLGTEGNISVRIFLPIRDVKTL